MKHNNILNEIRQNANENNNLKNFLFSFFFRHSQISIFFFNWYDTIIHFLGLVLMGFS